MKDFKKNFYDASSSSDVDQSDVDKFRRHNVVSIIRGHQLPPPILSFSYSFPEVVARALKDMGFKEPTPIQAQVSPKNYLLGTRFRPFSC